MNDERTTVVAAIWAVFCAFVVATGSGGGPDAGVFVPLAFATVGLAAVTRRWIVVLFPPLLALPFALATGSLPTWELGFGLVGAALSALTVGMAVRQWPADYHPPFRFSRSIQAR